MSHLVSRPKRESEVAVGGRMPQAKTATEPALDDYESYEVIAWRMRVILPTTWFRVLWDWILIGLVLYNLVSIPLEICLLVGKAIPPGVRALNIMVDAFFIFDLYFNFRTAFIEEVRGHEHTRVRACACALCAASQARPLARRA